MIGLLMKVAEEFKAPVSFAVMMALIVGMSWLAHDHVSQEQVAALVNDHVSRADWATLTEKVVSLQSGIDGVKYTLNRNHAENDLNDIRKQIYEAKRALAKDKDDGKTWTASHDLQDRQLAKLQSDEATAVIYLNAIINHERE